MARKKGFAALAVVLFLTSVFVLVTTVVGNDAINMLHNNLGNQFQDKANFCCYAALENSLYNIDQNTGFNYGSYNYYTNWDPQAETPNWTTVGKTVDEDPTLHYTVYLNNNSKGAPGTHVTDPDQTIVPGGTFYIKIHAVCEPDNTMGGRTYYADIASLGYVGSVYWSQAVLGTDHVYVTNGSVVDGYDSGKTQWNGGTWDGGTYTSGGATQYGYAYLQQWAIYTAPNGHTNHDNGITNARNAMNNSTIGTNGIQQSIAIYNNDVINGTYKWGPDGQPAVAVVAPAVETDPTSQFSAYPTGPTANTEVYRIPRFCPPWNPQNAMNATVNVYAGDDITLPWGGYQGLNFNGGGIVRLQSKSYNDNANPPQPCYQYYFNHGITMNGGNITLTPDNPDPNGAPINCSRVEVYCGNAVNMTNGAIINAPNYGDPSTAQDDAPYRFQLIFVGDGGPKGTSMGQVFTVNGTSTTGTNTAYFGTAIGPGLYYNVFNGGTVWGCCRCFGANINGGNLHYDLQVYQGTPVTMTPDPTNMRYGQVTETFDEIRGKVSWTLKGLVTEGYQGPADMMVGSGG